MCWRARCNIWRQLSALFPTTLRDLVVVVVEHLAQQEHRALDRTERLEHHQERHRDRLGERQPVARRGRALRHQRLREPRTDVGLALHARRAQVVDRQARHDRRQPGPRRVDLLVGSVLPAQEGVLHDVLRIAHAAEHAIGDPEEQAAMLLEGLGAVHHSTRV
jgi:hypothetical protein